MKKILVFDTETAGGFSAPLVYDVGGVVMDSTGFIHHRFHYAVLDIIGNPHLMDTAYYAEKIPSYLIDIDRGARRVARFFFIRSFIRELIKKYNIVACIAHNMRFDNNALNNTCKVLSDGLTNYFFPYGVKLWCTLAMARSLLTNSPTYRKWCSHYGFTLRNGTPRMTAEVIYRFITNNPDFTEKHTGIEDVLIEKDIFSFLCRKHKAMQRTYWKE